MNKDCVIFACSIFDSRRLFILDNLLKTFSTNFKEYDFYIGINYNSLTNVEEIIYNYNLNVSIERLSEESLYSKSDASAYQVALKLLKNSKKTYSNYWFVHTKGGVNDYSTYLNNWYINNFLLKNENITNFLNNEEYIGSYGLLGIINDLAYTYNDDVDIPLLKNKITTYLPYSYVRFHYLHSIYIITSYPMEIFLNNISNVWFTTKLDRYYFEGVFPLISSRVGRYPYISNRYSCNGYDIKDRINEWIESNNLTHYRNVYNFNTEYKFNQLNPPQ